MNEYLQRHADYGKNQDDTAWGIHPARRSIRGRQVVVHSDKLFTVHFGMGTQAYFIDIQCRQGQSLRTATATRPEYHLGHYDTMSSGASYETRGWSKHQEEEENWGKANKSGFQRIPPDCGEHCDLRA